jgi:hypothetical protein
VNGKSPLEESSSLWRISRSVPKTPLSVLCQSSTARYRYTADVFAVLFKGPLVPMTSTHGHPAVAVGTGLGAIIDHRNPIRNRFFSPGLP